MSKFFNLAFWFNQRPEALIPFWRTFLISVIIASFALAVIIFIFKKRAGLYAKLLEKFFAFFTANFFIGLLLLFFNQEMIPLLSSRFWYLFWILGIIVWLFFIARYALTLPKKKKKYEQEKEFQKYIPK